MTYYQRQINKLNEELYPRKDIPERMIRARRYIERNYSKNIDLDDICAHAYFSKYHFIRLFKSIYGRTPYQYLTEVRIEKAKELIRGGMTVRGACFSVGYNSFTSFSALFKKVTGSAPSRLE